VRKAIIIFAVMAALAVAVPARSGDLRWIERNGEYALVNDTQLLARVLPGDEPGQFAWQLNIPTDIMGLYIGGMCGSLEEAEGAAETALLGRAYL
jgi:hypothetical protein